MKRKFWIYLTLLVSLTFLSVSFAGQEVKSQSVRVDKKIKKEFFRALRKGDVEKV